MSKRRRSRFALAVLAAALLAGCGGDEQLSGQEYVAELNAMCESFRAQEMQIGDPQTVNDLVEDGPRIVAAFESTIVDRIHSLHAPDDLADEADQAVSVADRRLELLRALVAAAKANDIAKVRDLAAKNDALNQEADSVMRRLGATSCTTR